MIYTIWNKKESKNIAEDKMMIYIVKNINMNKYSGPTVDIQWTVDLCTARILSGHSGRQKGWGKEAVEDLRRQGTYRRDTLKDLLRELG